MYILILCSIIKGNKMFESYKMTKKNYIKIKIVNGTYMCSVYQSLKKHNLKWKSY